MSDVFEMVEEMNEGILNKMILTLPFPPSQNNLWKGASKGHYSSDAYKKWKAAADVAYQQQRRHIGTPIKGNFTYHITLDEKKRANRDGDNFTKAVLDQLQRLELIENDKLANAGSWTWGPVQEPGTCQVFVYQKRT